MWSAPGLVCAAGGVVSLHQSTLFDGTAGPGPCQARLRDSAVFEDVQLYDPKTAVGIPENALALNELQWHQCAHDAVRSYEKVNLLLAPLYDSLIDQDTRMTSAIMQGQMTRSERHARISQILAEIKAAEQTRSHRRSSSGRRGMKRCKT